MCSIALPQFFSRIRLLKASESNKEINERITANKQRRAVCASAPGVWMNEYIAKGMVWVSPAILDTKVMVAPNSPKERANPNTKPANTPGRERGNVIVKKTRQGEAPKRLCGLL